MDVKYLQENGDYMNIRTKKIKLTIIKPEDYYGKYLLEIEEKALKDEFLMKRNANIPQTGMAYLIGLEEKTLWENEILPKLRQIMPDWYYAETTGQIYTFKIRSGGLVLPYCGSVNTSEIPKRRFIETKKIIYRCAKYGVVLVNHILDIALYLTLERTGAVGLNYIDCAVAPFIRDEYNYLVKVSKVLRENGVEVSKLIDPEHHIQQIVEAYHYNANKPSRYVYQSMFINELFGISCGEKVLKDIELYKEGRKVGYAIDYVDEMMLYLKYSLLSFLQGDAIHQPFTFPIPSVYLTDDFLKLLREYDLWNLFWEVVAKRGTFYFMNPNVSNPDDAYSFCCRLRVSKKRIIEDLRKKKVVTGRWITLTGSIGYAGLNMPRIAFESKGDLDKAFELILQRMYIARKILQYLRHRYLILYRLGMYPVTAWLIDDLGKYEKNPFETYYNTIAVVGFAEYLSIMTLMNRSNSEIEKLAEIGSPLPKIDDIPFISVWCIPDEGIRKEMIDIAIKTLIFMKRVMMEFEQEDDVLYNLELAPAEEAGAKLALIDFEKFKEMRKYIPRDVDPFTNNIFVYYTSQLIPYYTIMNLDQRIWFENEICSYKIKIDEDYEPLFDGGYVMFIHMPMYVDVEKVAKLITRIVKETNIVYIAYTPVQSICRNCHTFLPGVYDECPVCGSKEVDKWDRIVGYYTRVSDWNPGRRAEWTTRIRRKITI